MALIPSGGSNPFGNVSSSGGTGPSYGGSSAPYMPTGGTNPFPPVYPITTPPQHGSQPAPPRETVPGAESDKPIPIIYGTGKVAPDIIDKVAATVIDVPSWTTSKRYVKNEVVQNGGNTFQCQATGVSASSGSGPQNVGGSNITTDGTVTWQCIQDSVMKTQSHAFIAGLCEGPVADVLTTWMDKDTWVQETTANPGRRLQFTAGDATNSSLSVFSRGYNYSSTAAVYAPPSAGFLTGSQAELPNFQFEVAGFLLGSDSPDVNPYLIVEDFLTNTRYGAGMPTSFLFANSTTQAADASSSLVYCDAYGLRLSLVLESTTTVLDLLGRFLQTMNCDAVVTGGKLKFVPLCDLATTSTEYGSTNYTPNLTATYNLTIDDFIAPQGEAPIRISQRRDADIFNTSPVSFTDRAAGYQETTVEDPDIADQADRGVRKAPVTSLDLIFPGGSGRGSKAPAMVARLLAQRSLYVTNTYEFSVGWNRLDIEPTDVLTITDPVAGLNLVPVRVVTTEEQEDGTIHVVAEDFPAGVAAASGFIPQTQDGITQQTMSTTVSVAPAPTLSLATSASVTSLPRTNLDNLFPNGNSETPAPAGIDTTLTPYSTSAEWGYVSTAVPNNGSKHRALPAGTTLDCIVPCTKNDAFYFEGYGRQASSNASGFHIEAQFLTAAMATIGSAISSTPLASTTTYTNSSVTLTASSSTTAYVRFRLVASSAVTTYFDDMYARRTIDRAIITVDALRTSNYAEDGSGNPTAGAKLDHIGTALKVAPGNLQVGSKFIDATYVGNTIIAGCTLDYSDSTGILTLTTGYNVASVSLSGTLSSMVKITFGSNVPASSAYSASITKSTKGTGTIPTTELTAQWLNSFDVLNGSREMQITRTNGSGTKINVTGNGDWHLHILVLFWASPF